MNYKQVIDSFSGEYEWLSNFYMTPVYYDGLLYTNAEAAFQSAKLKNKEDRVEFTNMLPKIAKARGKKVKLREDWEAIKLDVMHNVVFNKFVNKSMSNLGYKLIYTGDAELIEGNNWKDRYWGVYNGIGENHLGKILMKVRSELIDIAEREYY